MFIRLIKGEWRKIHPLMYVVAGMFVVYFAQGVILGLING